MARVRRPGPPYPEYDNYLQGRLDARVVRARVRGQSTKGDGVGYYDLIDTSREEQLPPWLRNGAGGYHDFRNGFFFVWRHGGGPASHRVAVARLPATAEGQDGSAEPFICANDVTTAGASLDTQRVFLRGLSLLPSCAQGVPVQGEVRGVLSDSGDRSTATGTVDGAPVTFGVTGRFASPEGRQYELFDQGHSGFDQVGLVSLLPRASTFLILPAPAGPQPGAVYCAQAAMIPGRPEDAPMGADGPIAPPLPRGFVLQRFVRVGRCPGVPAAGELHTGPPPKR